jgi:hypothetical protein
MKIRETGAKTIVAGVALLVVAAGVLRGDIAAGDPREVQQAAAGPNQVNAYIVNPATDPVKSTILGTVTTKIGNTAAEAIPVMVQGETTVNAVLTGTPTVSVAPRSTLAVFPKRNVTVAAGNTMTFHISSAEYEEIRVVVQVTSTSPLTVSTFFDLMRIDDAPIQAGGTFTQVYRLAGTGFDVSVSNEQGTEEGTANVAIYGR